MKAVVFALALVAGLWAMPAVQANSAAGTRPLTYAEIADRVTGRSLLKKKFKLGREPGPSKTDKKCGPWRVGTATGYSTDGTDKGDKPMAPNDLGEWIVPGRFFKARNVVAIDWGNWKSDKYRNIEISLEGKVGTFSVWDFCNDKDCAKDNPKCCSTNKETYSKPGYLLDVETHGAHKVWGLKDAQNWLVAPVWYRVCGKFDRKKDVKKYKMKCMGVKGDGKCS